MERTAGKRWESLHSLTQAFEIRVDDALRLEATATITRPGLRVLPDQVALDNFHNMLFGVSSSPKLSPDGKYLAIALQDKKMISFPGGVKVVEWLSGKPLRTRTGSTWPSRFDRERRNSPWQIRAAAYLFGRRSTDKEIARYPGWNAAFSTDGSYLLTEEDLAGKKIPHVWDLTSGQEAKPPPPSMFQGFLSGHEALLLHEGRYQVWDCRAGREAHW